MESKISILFLPVIFSIVIISSCADKKDSPQPTTITPAAMPVDKSWTFETTPFFTDEFSNTGKPDSAKWNYDIGGGGWGNNELEYYTNLPENANVANGILSINAKKEAYNGMNYTSARLVSKGTGSMLYGRIEVSAKLPSGRGLWPAVWMLPDVYTYGSWPKSGEIDVMENVGYDPNPIYFTIHTQLYNGAIGTQKGASKNITDASTAFHKYRVDWTPYAVRGYYDDVLLFIYINDGNGSTSWPFDQKFHLLLNIAVGGNWGGIKGVDDTAFPTSMQVNYVHFYKMIDK
ncbi:MAG: glycoside hydrolase family 16 protein [Sphingobacteriaceae bacterium]|nr:MAG: glycoside hydrolase family 16 protein [Sphingobacteriaceae bacterium]